MQKEIENKALSELEEEIDVPSLQEKYKRMIMTEVSHRFVDKLFTGLCERNNFSDRILNELQNDIDKRICNKRYLTNPKIAFIEKNGTTYGPITLEDLIVRSYWRGSQSDLSIFEEGANPRGFGTFINKIHAGHIKIKIYEEDKK